MRRAIRIHYSSSPDANPKCEKCGVRINPGLMLEPYTRTLSIWLSPPHGYTPCTEEKKDDPNTAGEDDSSTSPSEMEH